MKWCARQPSVFCPVHCRAARRVGRSRSRCRLRVAGGGICHDRSPGHPERCGASKAADRACQQWLGNIVTVGAREDYRERDALRFGDEVVL
jgi:hypothetical protein